MNKGICAFKNCTKQSEYLLTYRIVKEMGGKLQESNSVDGCYCESHATIMLQDRQDLRPVSAPMLQKIDEINLKNPAVVDFTLADVKDKIKIEDNNSNNNNNNN